MGDPNKMYFGLQGVKVVAGHVPVPVGKGTGAVEPFPPTT